MNFWNFFVHNQAKLLDLTIEHIQMVGLALLIAIIIGVPIGIYLTTNESLANLVLQMASVMMTIPSIALFGIMMPILSIVGHGIGFVPAVVALILYSQLPIIRNTYTAIKNVDHDIRDAANGIGMTVPQRLLKIEIPNAIPLIMGGIRTSVVLNIGIGAIAAFIGAGGLGVMINQGISRTDNTMIIMGSIAVSILAIIADILLGLLQKWVTPKGIRS